ncbi:MAG: RES family NAD+ phosphorylase [Cytophagales bacterium]|nr:RES family NAD+ phosphorylase [Cytophagales bacterium]
MIVYRICKTYPPDHDPIDGRGAFQSGGRWNSKGVPAVYTSSSQALARAELGRHVELRMLPDDYRVYDIELPDGSWVELPELPQGWDADPPLSASRVLGDAFLNEHKYLALRVPSVCDPESYNFILNPRAKVFDQVRVIRHYLFVP